MTREFMTLGDATMSSFNQTIAGLQERDRTLREAEDHSDAAMTYAVERFRIRWAACGVSAQMTDSAVQGARSRLRSGLGQCDSPIEKILLPWLVFEDYGSQINGPGKVHLPSDELALPHGDLIIIPQFAFARYRFDFAILAADMTGRHKMLVVECDGAEFHRSEADEIRDAYVARFDIETIRASGSEIHRAPQAVSARVADAIIGWAGV